MESKENGKELPEDSISPEETNGKTTEAPKKRSKVFLIILIVMLLLGAWFGIFKYRYAQHHEETD